MSSLIAITLGEPAGIGVELVVKLAQQGLLQQCEIVGDHNLIQHYIDEQQLPVSINHQKTDHGLLRCHHIACDETVEWGVLNPKNSAYVLKLLDHAAKGCLEGRYAAMVTGPLHKGVINDASETTGQSVFTGHTEYLAEITNTPQVVMMLLNQHMRVALATTHIPLKEVSENITKKGLQSTLDIIIADMQKTFGIKQPKIAVCGLNPHAGEDGHLGMEEINTINPVIKSFQAKGHQIYGSIPADTLFTVDKLKNYDAVLAMYHDQGLAPLKYAGFGESVNITLGLPFIRTSVDHGTALDIAGQHIASADSLQAALTLTKELLNHDG